MLLFFIPFPGTLILVTALVDVSVTSMAHTRSLSYLIFTGVVLESPPKLALLSTLKSLCIVTLPRIDPPLSISKLLVSVADLSVCALVAYPARAAKLTVKSLMTVASFNSCKLSLLPLRNVYSGCVGSTTI